tara:strand:+ start:18325 stop:18426 length:102 start_codon:yes stop_codon:yes gene_type:complete
MSAVLKGSKNQKDNNVAKTKRLAKKRKNKKGKK